VGSVKLNDVMDELAARIGTITGLRVFGYPPPTVVPPAGIVSYPDKIEYDQTYGRGMTTLTGLPILIVVGKATDRTAREAVAAYASDTGPKSVKLAIEGTSSTAWDDAHVVDCDFDVVTIASVDYIAALFSLTIACQGGTP
jgi:hypothetical protein